MRLVTFGDSFTYGQGLDGTPTAHPMSHDQAWPCHMAESMGAQLDNQSVPGASNKLIWYMAMNYEYQPDDIVVVAWSCNTRWLTVGEVRHSMYADPRTELELHDNNQFRQYGSWMEDQPDIMSFYLNNWHSVDMHVEFCSKMDQLNRYLQNKLGPRVFFCSIPFVTDFIPLTKYPKPIREQYDWDSALRQCREHFKDYQPSPWDDTVTSFRLEEGEILAGCYGKPPWLSADILTSMSPEMHEYPATEDGHMGLEGGKRFAERMLNLMHRESPEIFS